MLDHQEKNSTSNPFVGYQTFYLRLFANVHAPDQEGYVKGKNDHMYFKLTLVVDENMKKNDQVTAITKGENYHPLAESKKVSGFLKSVSVSKDVVNGKPTKKIQFVLYDPTAPYYNPFEEVDANNPLNGKTTGALYIVSSAFTLKSKELLSKLANVDGSITDQPITVSIVPANSKESGYKEQIVIAGKKVYNILVKQGDNVVRERFGDPSRGSFIQQDSWNEDYLRILNEFTDDDLRIEMDRFYEKFVKNVMSASVHEMFLSSLRNHGYDLVENGTNQDGTPRLKYIKLGETMDVQEMTNVITPSKSFKAELESTMPMLDEDADVVVEDSDDLPF